MDSQLARVGVAYAHRPREGRFPGGRPTTGEIGCQCRLAPPVTGSGQHPITGGSPVKAEQILAHYLTQQPRSIAIFHTEDQQAPQSPRRVGGRAACLPVEQTPTAGRRSTEQQSSAARLLRPGAFPRRNGYPRQSPTPGSEPDSRRPPVARKSTPPMPGQARHTRRRSPPHRHLRAAPRGRTLPPCPQNARTTTSSAKIVLAGD